MPEQPRYISTETQSRCEFSGTLWRKFEPSWPRRSVGQDTNRELNRKLRIMSSAQTRDGLNAEDPRQKCASITHKTGFGEEERCAKAVAARIATRYFSVSWVIQKTWLAKRSRMCRPQRASRGRQNAAWQDLDELLGPDSRGVKGRARRKLRNVVVRGLVALVGVWTVPLFIWYSYESTVQGPPATEVESHIPAGSLERAPCQMVP